MVFASVASSNSKVKLDLHADTCNGLGIHDHNRLVNIYNYDPKMATEVPRQMMSKYAIVIYEVNISIC